MEEAKKTGTTILGIVGKDYVILAADKQTTYGTVKYNRETKKIHPVADYMALATSGLVGDAQVLTRFLENRVRSLEIETGKRPSPSSIANYLSLILNSSKYFPFWVGLLLAGYTDKPYLASIDAAGGVEERDKFTADGSGMYYALAVLESGYRKGMSVDEAVQLAVKAVEASRKLDIYSGGDEPGIDVAVIDKKGIRFLSKEEVSKVKESLKN